MHEKVTLRFGGHGVGTVTTVPFAADHGDILLEIFEQFVPPY